MTDDPAPTAPPSPPPAPERDAVPAPFHAADRAIEAAGIPWVRLRPIGHGDEDDLLVGTTGPALAAALATAGFAPVDRPGRGSHRAFHAIDPGTGAWAKVDAVERIDLGPYQECPTGLARGFLERRRGGELHPDDAFWALLLHELWDRPAPAIRRRAELRALADNALGDGPTAAAVAGLLPRGVTASGVLAMARADDVDGLVALGRRMRAGIDPGRDARRTARRIARWIDRRDPPFVRRGLTVALLGPDGTGKSTLSHGLEQGLPLPVRAVYLGLYGGQRGRRRGRSIPGLGFVGRLARMWRGWLVARWHVSRGRVVVFDRHPYDARLPTADGSRPSRGRRWLARSLPSPDLVVVLDAPAEVLYARKPEFSTERLAALRAGYVALAAALPRATLVDVDRPADAVRAEVASIVWSAIVDRRRARGAGR